MDKKKIFIVLCLFAAVFMLTVNVSAADMSPAAWLNDYALTRPVAK